MRAWGILVAAAVAGSASVAGAADATVPSQSDICVHGLVDKRLLVDFLASANHLRWSFADDVAADKSVAFKGVPTWKRLLADPDICGGGITCSKADKAALESAQFELISLLSQQGQAYRSDVKDPKTFLLDDRAQLRCVAQAGAPVEADGAKMAKVTYTSKFRIRGIADDLYWGRDDAAFKGLSKATLSFANDETGGKRTDKLVGVIGYEFDPAIGGSNRAILVPYVGFNRNVVRTTGKATSVSSDTADVGFVAAIGTVGDGPTPLGSWWTVRPDYLFDHSDHSGIASLNLVYTPIVNNRQNRFALNDYIRLKAAEDDFASWEPILELHLDNGWYTQRGITPAAHTDYNRLGVKVGASLTSDNPAIPFTVTVTETELAGLRGSLDSLSYFTSAISWSPDTKGYFTVDLSYTNGNREDTGKREQATGIGLAAKF